MLIEEPKQIQSQIRKIIQHLLCSLKTNDLAKKKPFNIIIGHCVQNSVNSFPNKPLFLRASSTNLLKTLREKEKLLVTSNFIFSHSVFYPFGELSAIFIKLKIVVCKLFQYGRVQNLLCGKGLTLCHKLLLQFSCYCILLKSCRYLDYIDVMQDSLQPSIPHLMVQGLSPLDPRKILLTLYHTIPNSMTHNRETF